jgi:hypothetical protein
MNNVGQNTLSPFKVLSAEVALRAAARSSQRQVIRAKGSKSIAALISEARSVERSEDTVWLVLALCGWLVLGLSLWL